MSNLLVQYQAQLLHFVQVKSDEFHSVLKECFASADTNNNGTIEAEEAAKLVDIMFDRLQGSLNEYGIKVTKISETAIRNIMKQADINGDQKLDEEEFKEFFLKLVALMGVKFASGFTNKYGIGILCGIGGIVVAKTAVESIPVAGKIAKPILALIPTLLIGSVLGVAVVYGLDQVVAIR
eukprot:TRINITY_DN6498_c0_g1_i9.p1 TRINITY_DN6498_c0_g1~~TRINITY_DN6498_c0_g1_i9.p1  ORF type:complete len:196 (+),score=20.93 TRINITY_DN6498_c0_g1_i9:49-588(+)